MAQKTPSSPRTRKLSSVPPPMEAAAQAPATDRQQLIAERAYRLAESRGFAPGAELEDWLAAEREVDTMLGRQTS